MYAIVPHTLDVVPVTVDGTFSAILGSGIRDVSQKLAQQRPRLLPGTGVPGGPGLARFRFAGAVFGPCCGQAGGFFDGLRARLHMEQEDSATTWATQAWLGFQGHKAVLSSLGCWR